MEMMKELTIKISKITVFVGYGVDVVYIVTNDFENPIWPFDGNLTMKFDAARNSGVEYVRRHFNMEPEIINIV